MHLMLRTVLSTALGALLLVAATEVAHAQTHPFEEVESRYDFAETVARLERAVELAPLDIVTRVAAHEAAAELGVTVPGNEVWGLFAPKYVVRMLQASLRAGYEAPLRLYLLETEEGTVLVRYKRPTRVFAPYGSRDLDAMARDLNHVFAGIVRVVR